MPWPVRTSAAAEEVFDRPSPATGSRALSPVQPALAMLEEVWPLALSKSISSEVNSRLLSGMVAEIRPRLSLAPL